MNVGKYSKLLIFLFQAKELLFFYIHEKKKIKKKQKKKNLNGKILYLDPSITDR